MALADSPNSDSNRTLMFSVMTQQASADKMTGNLESRSGRKKRYGCTKNLHAVAPPSSGEETEA
jgi:hypothetical protein